MYLERDSLGVYVVLGYIEGLVKFGSCVWLNIIDV